LFGVSAWLGLAAGVVAAAGGAALIGFFCVRTSGIPFLMLTLAFSQLVFSVALKWRDVTGGSDGMAIAEKPALFGLELSNSYAMYWTASGDILIMTMLGGAGTLIGPAIGAGVFLLMKNVVSSYSEHWLAIIGGIFICCVLFFPGGIWGTLRQLPLPWRKAADKP